MEQRDGGSARPAVSVCVPLYNKVAFVAETLESVLAQRFTDFELIVVENASTDGSDQVLERFTDPRLVVVHNDRTVPMVENFSRAVEQARAPLVKLMCADDLLRPECLERQVDAIESDPGLAVVVCRQDLIDATGRVLRRGGGLRSPDLIGRRRGADVIRTVVRRGGNPVGDNNCMVFRRSALEAAGGLTGSEGLTLDVELCVRLCSQGDFLGMPESLVRFRAPSARDYRTPRRTWYAAQRRFTRRIAHIHRGSLRPGDAALGAARVQVARLRYRE